ncbi:hydrolase TatD [bacterium]|nr:hydrolase TatD [bacterium]
MIDTHAHTYGKAFESDLDQVVSEARLVGVERVYLPNIDAASIAPMRDAHERFPGFFRMMMGLHPCSVDEDLEEQLGRVEQEWNVRAVDYCAVGEIGLDRYWRKDNTDVQMQVLDRQMDWAVERGLPVSVHCREAFDALFELFEHRKHLNKELPTGVIHCFTGQRSEAERCLDEGFHLGIGGVVTYPKAGLGEVLRGLPLERMVLETDSPYVSPVPYRGKPNRPAYLVPIAAALALAMDEDESRVREVTQRNALRVFEPPMSVKTSLA